MSLKLKKTITFDLINVYNKYTSKSSENIYFFTVSTVDSFGTPYYY